MRTCGSGNMAGLLGAAVLARETESSTMPIVANSGLYLVDAPFGISGSNGGGGVSGRGCIK